MMQQNIEQKVRFNVALIYIIAALMGIVLLIYLYQARENIDRQRHEIDRQRDLWSVTHRLIRSVHESQALYAQYVSTQNPVLLQEFNLNLGVIDRIVDTLNTKPHNSLPVTKIRNIIDLLNQQSRTTEALRRLFEAQNPLYSIQETLKNRPQDRKPDSVFVRTYTHKQVVKPTPKKGFFKRIADAFVPSKDSTTETVLNQLDTLIVASKESSALSDEIDRATRQAGDDYDQRIHSIEQSLTRLISSNQTLSAEIATLLFDLQEESFGSILATVDRSEAQIRRSYTHSIVGSVAAFLLILLLVSLVLRNVDRAKQARIALEAANLHINQIMESRHRLLLSVSHDLKTPLSSILGYLEYLKNDHPEEMRSMRNSGNYILALIENLLEYSSLEQGSLKVTKTTFSPYVLLKDIAEMFQPIATQKGLVMTVDFDFQKDLILLSDPIKIKQIAINIISNALKYTREGGVGWIVGYDRSELTIEVTDTGAGIPQSSQKDLFRPFSRIERNNHLAQGSGLGLFVVKGLIELLGGKLFLESEEGKGSKFTVRIPAQEVFLTLSDRSLDIVVVDDDSVVSELLARMLRDCGHTVRTVLPQDPIGQCDLIVTDLEMGDYSGVDVLKKAGSIPVILMTGRSDFTKEEAIRLGFYDYLCKPFSQETVRLIFGKSTATSDSLMGDDPEFKQHILRLFEEATQEHCKLLEEAVVRDDFDAARAVCHKMIPLFAEFHFTETVAMLRKIDSHRDGSAFDGWKEEIEQLLSMVRRQICAPLK